MTASGLRMNVMLQVRAIGCWFGNRAEELRFSLEQGRMRRSSNRHTAAPEGVAAEHNDVRFVRNAVESRFALWFPSCRQSWWSSVARRGPHLTVVPSVRTSGACYTLGRFSMSISASEARKTLFPLIERVNADRDAVEIVSRKGNAVLMPADEYAAWQETAYLFRSPTNARRLLDAYERARAGKTQVHELDRSGPGD